jgi:hypothetical protein
MVLISHKHQFIFTRTFKTGSTSIEQYFQQYCLPKHLASIYFKGFYEGSEGIVGKDGQGAHNYRFYAHMPAEAVKKEIGDRLWNDYFKFAIVRNPFTKLISAYFFLKHLEGKVNAVKRSKNRLKWYFPLKPEFYPPSIVDDFDRDIKNFRKWLQKGAYWSDKPAYMINGDIKVDTLMKFENLLEDTRKTCNRLSLPFISNNIPQAKTNVKPEWAKPSEFYDTTTKNLVFEMYRFEFETFNYTFPG